MPTILLFIFAAISASKDGIDLITSYFVTPDPIDWADVGQRQVHANNVTLDNPLDIARTIDFRSLPLASTVSREYVPTSKDITGFTTDSCVISFDLEAVPSEGGVRVEEIFVRVNKYEPPPYILNVLSPMPFQEAHIVYVQIDNPYVSGKSIFRARPINYSEAGQLLVQHDISERVYVMVGAINPGVYHFDIGVVTSYKDQIRTHWVTNQTVYFVQKENDRNVLIEDPIATLASESDFSEQMQAIKQLSETSSPGALQALKIKALGGGIYPQVNAAAAAAIGKLDDPESTAVLINIWKSSGTDFFSYSGTALGLGYLDNLEATQFLINELTTEDDADKRGYLIQALENITIIDVVPILVELLRSDNEPENRAIAATLLGRVGGIPGKEALTEALQQDTSPEVKGTAALSLASLRFTDVNDKIRNAMLTVEIEDRTPFILALRELNDQKSIPLLIEFLKAYYPDRLRFGMDSDIVSALSQLTGEHFGYINRIGDQNNNERIIQRWIQWWEKNSTTHR